MNIGERVAIVETDQKHIKAKLKIIERLQYVIMGGVGAQVVSPLIPMFWAPLG